RDARRLRARAEGDYSSHARRLGRGSDSPVLDVALGRIPARPGRPVQDPVARYARGGPCVDRDETEETPRLPRTARRLYGVHTRFAQTAELAVDRVVRRAADHPPLRHARHPRRGRLPGPGHGRAELALPGRGAEDEGREMSRV